MADITFLDLAAVLAIFIMAFQYAVNTFLRDLLKDCLKAFKPKMDEVARINASEKWLIKPARWVVLLGLVAALSLGIMGFFGWKVSD